MMKLNGPELKMQEEWLNRHRGATELIVHAESGVWAYAIYVNPIYQACVAEPMQFWEEIRKLMGERQ